MSVFRRVKPAGEARGIVVPAYLTANALAFGGGPHVSTPDQALRDAATWACVKVKAQGIASLPIDVVRYESDQRIPVPAPQIITAPSGIVSRRVWTFQAASSMFTDGNVFGLVQAVDGSARPSQIELVDPSCVTNRDVVDGVTQVTIKGTVHRLFPFGDLWHMPGEMVMPGSPFGLSPVTYGSRSTGTALAAEEFGGRFFTDGGHPSSVYKSDQEITKQQALDLKASIMATQRGREPAVIGSGWTREEIQIHPEDTQFIELMRFEVEQTCRRHGVPPSMVYAAISGQNVTYANVTQADLHFLKHTLSYPISLFEDALGALIPPSDQVRYNRDSVLRADTLGRYQAYAIADEMGLLTLEEMRQLEDLAPLSAEDKRQTRAWQEVGLPALVADGLMTVNEARAQLGLPPVEGGDTPRDPGTEGNAA